jgi:hypothetical protein
MWFFALHDVIKLPITSECLSPSWREYMAFDQHKIQGQTVRLLGFIADLLT